VDEHHPVQPVDQFMAFLAAEADDQGLDVSDVFVSPMTLGTLRQSVKVFLGFQGLPSAAIEVMRFPTVQPTLPHGWALLRPPNDRLAARKVRKAVTP
jgi:hypothetical protein